MYNRRCCGMIAEKREVAAFVAGFPWSECQVRKLTASHCTNNCLQKVETTCEVLRGMRRTESGHDVAIRNLSVCTPYYEEGDKESATSWHLTAMTHTGMCTVTACRTI